MLARKAMWLDTRSDWVSFEDCADDVLLSDINEEIFVVISLFLHCPEKSEVKLENVQNHSKFE